MEIFDHVLGMKQIEISRRQRATANLTTKRLEYSNNVFVLA